jgi:2-(1,2-epoxy-1,2-dihydrophenyl)acetyl-CoA isomerase
MDLETVILKKENGVATIILNRPERLNAINDHLINDLGAAMDDVGMDDDIKAVVLTGAGKAFCVGGDFRYSQVRSGEIGTEDAEDVGEKGARYLTYRQGRLLSRMHKRVPLGLIEMEKPTIAMINGDAVGGGFEFTCACDLAIMSDRARLGIAFTRIGLTPQLGSSWLLPRLIGVRRTMELIMLGDIWGAEDAYRVGLVNRVFPADKLESETMAIARRLAESPPIGLRLSKQQVYNGLRMDLDVGMSFGTASMYLALLTDDHMEGIQAFAEKRKPIPQDR